MLSECALYLRCGQRTATEEGPAQEKSKQRRTEKSEAIWLRSGDGSATRAAVVESGVTAPDKPSTSGTGDVAGKPSVTLAVAVGA